MNQKALITPYGGELLNLMGDTDRVESLKQEATSFPSITLSPRQLCDIELLLNGAFSPLTGFMNQADYESVLRDVKLADGTIWPLPITLDVSEAIAKDLKADDKVALRDHEGVILAILTIGDVWQPDKKEEAELAFGTDREDHPAVDYLMNLAGSHYVGGSLEGLELPKHYDFQLLRHTPQELRDQFAKLGWSKIVAFQTRNPLHRVHQALTMAAAKEVGGDLLIHPVVGMTNPGDVDHYTRVRVYQSIMKHYPPGTTTLSLLPLAMRMAGPKEALLHAIIRRNYGCTHLIVGRDHAGPRDKDGNNFYGPYDAQDLMKKHQDEIGIEMVDFKRMVYVEDKGDYMTEEEVPEGARVLRMSGTEMRRRLQKGLDLPDWFTYPEVAEELHKAYPPRNRQGFTVFFTGLSGSGKSTIANALLVKLMEHGKRRVTLLDGDIVRINLSSELGFSKEHRDLNITRIGFVASEITKNGGIAICAPIAPYQAIRRQNRNLIESVGAYIEVHVATSLEECERRDVKGLYAKARQGIIKGFTGIDDPYEAPENPEIYVDTEGESPEQSVQKVLLYLEKEGYLG